MSEISHNFWPDGTPRSAQNAFDIPPSADKPTYPQLAYYYRQKAKGVPSYYERMKAKANRVNPSRPNDPSPQASADKTAKINGRM